MNVVGMYVQDFDAGHRRFLHSPVELWGRTFQVIL